MNDAICTHCGQTGHRASHCPWPTGSLVACMGGWCRKREHCAHFHAIDRSSPSERLCMPGQDGRGMAQPVVIHIPAGGWERTGAAQLLSRAQPFDALQVIA